MNRPENEIISERAPADTTPVVVGIKPWNATEPTEIQLPPSIRLVGERQSNGSLTPLRVCGYVFREADIENWMDSQQLMLELKTYAGERADRGWSLIMQSLIPHGIGCRLVRAYIIDEYGDETKWRCTSKSLIIGTNETKQDRIGARSMKKVEKIHKALNLPMGALGAPKWLKSAECR